MIFDTDITKYELYAQTTPLSSNTLGYGFVHIDRNVYPNVEFDLILPVFLKKTYDYYEYVDVKRDSEIAVLNRQDLGDLGGMTDQEVRVWFDTYGIYQLPWNKGASNETTLAEIETNGILMDTIIGRAQLFNITINT